MVTIADIIYIVVFSSLVLKGNAADICLIKQNATSGKKGVLTCVYPFRTGDGNIVMYWKNKSDVICYVKTSEETKCVGLQPDIAEGKMTLTIPNLKVSDTGRYTCNIFTKNNFFECNIDLFVAVEGRRNRIGSNGTRIKAGPMFLLLPLVLFIGSFPFVSL